MLISSRPPGTMNAHPFRKVISDPSFKKLWVSQLLSQLTINLVNFSILTLIFEVTQSAVAVSMLWVAYSLPALFFAPFSGAIVDRFSRRKMMVITNFLQAGTVALYLFVPHQQIFTLYVLVFMYSFLDQLYLPSQQASIPSLVDKKNLSVANGIFLLTQQMSLLVGFGLGGVFLSVFGRQNTTILSTIFLLIASISVFLLPRDWAKNKRVHVDLETYLDDFKKGYHFLRANRSVLYPLLLIAFVQMLITIISVILPSYAKNVMGVDIYFASIAFLIPGALGAIALTYALPRLLKNRRKKLIVEAGMLSATISLFALSILGWAGNLKYILAVMIAVGIGLSIAAIMVPAQTLLQEKTPIWFRGRVYSSLSFLLIIGTSVPLLISATLVDFFGVSTMIAIVAFIILLGLFFVKRKGDYVLANGFGI
jgi:MFS family permease